MRNNLQIFTLGGLSIQVDGEPLIGLASHKADALLVYLACNQRTHAREVLAEMLWDERTQSQALANLRVVLASLRKHIADFLHIERNQVALRQEVNVWIDALELAAQLKPWAAQEGLVTAEIASGVANAVEHYKGEFLSGFYLREARGFEDWHIREQERLHQMVLDALVSLVDFELKSSAYQSGTAHARRLLELDPLMESAHRQLIQLLAHSGQRGAALDQYAKFSKLLDEELGVEPDKETQALYAQIQAGELELPPSPQQVHIKVQPPAFLSEVALQTSEEPIFVAREQELARLKDFLDKMLKGQAGVAFVIGGAGRGKSALLDAFSRTAQADHPDLIVAKGACNALTGVGDPYTPFREALGMLTGDVQSKWMAGVISSDHAKRLWQLQAASAQALVDFGPDLVEVFIPGVGLLSRASLAFPDQSSLLQSLRDLSEGGRALRGELGQRALFEQYQNVLLALARKKPLLLLLDDLQWADSASINLLFHLGRGLADAPILMVGAYRSEEVALGRGTERHPLDMILTEFKRLFGDIWIDLAQTPKQDERRFVDAFLDSESNRLDETFREALLAHTGGHPLFTIEMLRNLQERGDLVRDAQGVWVIKHELDWDILPTRVDGVIEARIGRLNNQLHQTLNIASVEGEHFTAQVVAQVQEIDERQLLHSLSADLEGRHRLVRGQGESRIGEMILSRYQFTHSVIHRFLYNNLGPGERRLLNGEVAGVLERLYEGRTDEISAPLAHHYREAGELDKAVKYLLLAGDRARNLYAHQEAIQLYEFAIEILKEQSQHERVARTLLKLGLAYHTAFDYQRSREAYNQAFSLFHHSYQSSMAGTLLPAINTLRLDIGQYPHTLDPGFSTDSYSSTIIRNLFSGLVETSPELDILPDSAQSWDISQGGRQYVFHLRPDLRWSDGRPLTAHDFEYAWKRVLSPANEIPIAELLYDLRGARAFHLGETPDPNQVGVRAIDPRTLVVDLEEPAGYFLSLLAHHSTYPVPRHVLEDFGQDWTEVDNLVNNGPFLLEDWRPEESLTLVRNPNYHGSYSGNVQRVELTNVYKMEHLDRLALYEDDQLDSLRIPDSFTQNTSHLQSRYPSEYITAPAMMTLYLLFNTNRAPLNDLRVRQALVMAIDVQEWVQVVAGDAYPPAMGGFIPPGLPGHSPGISLPYDLDRARQLMAEAGFSAGFGDLRIWIFFENFVPYSEYLKTHWLEALGVELVWELVPYKEFRGFFEGVHKEQPDLIATGWISDYPDPDNYLRIGAGDIFMEWTGWHNEAFESLLEKANQCQDQAERMALYQAADKILIEQAVVKPIRYGRTHRLVKPWVKNPLSLMGVEQYYKHVIIERDEQVGQTRDQGYFPAVSPMAGTLLPAINTLRLDMGHYPFTLDPGFSNDTFSYTIISNLFSGLVETSPELDILPDSAQSWEIFQGGRQYVFHLRPNLRWSDGRPLTAGDFEYAWKRVLNPANEIPNAELLYDLRGARAFHLGETPDPNQVGVRAIDPLTLVVDLEEPAGYFLSLLAYSSTFPVPRHVLEDFGQDWTEVDNLVNNGPFLLEDWQPEESLTLVRNPSYHGSHSGNVQRVELTNVYDMEPLDQLALYEDDQLDSLEIEESFIQNISHLQSRYPGEYITAPEMSILYLRFNTNRAPLNDLRVRQALVMAIDVQEWVQVVAGDAYPPAMGGLVPLGLPGHSPGISLPYDLDRARQLMTEAGFPGGIGDLRIWSFFKGFMPYLEYLKTRWLEALGVELVWELYPYRDWSGYIDRLKKEQPDLMSAAIMADYPDPDNFLRIGFGGFGAFDQEWIGWHNEAFESLSGQANQCQNQAERMALYQAADKILIEQVVVKPIHYGRTRRLVKPWVKNPLSLMVVDQYYKDVIIEPH